MIISLNWLKKFTDIDMPIDELVTLIGARLVEVEQVIDLNVKYKDTLVVKVVEANKLEGSDHLNVTKIDDGGITTDIERDENGLVQVVCGAPNIKAGQLVAWLPPKSIVPNTYNTAEQFVLGSRELRGVMSNGMIASARELDLFDEHEGILELDGDITPGTLFAVAYELDDYLLDIENKSLTHRPDCFGVIGFAREVAAISGKAFKTPEWLTNTSPDFNNIESSEFKLSAVIDNPELSARYQAIVLSDADSNKKSPLKIQTYLSRVGVRPINAVVDVTNYLMMLTGQPLHAFDYDKLVSVGGGSADIHVRAGHNGEKLVLLDGRTIELDSGDIIIAAGETAIGLAGAMGGANTAIDQNTRNIIIESATFNLYNLRSTQMRHGIFSEAITRFTKGQSPELTAPVLFDAIKLMGEWSGAKCTSQLAEAYPNKKPLVSIDFIADKINGVLGSSFSKDNMVNTLNNAEFTVELVDGSDTLKVIAPWWRADINIFEDVVEEIGRLNGFDNINPTLPIRDFTATRPNEFDDFRAKVRQSLVRAGANEVLSYSFVHGDILQKSDHSVENSYRIVNSISPNLQYYRQTLTPSLLGLIHPNIKQGYDNFAIFEINKAHQKHHGLTDENVPIETDLISLVVTSKNKQVGSPYYKAKRIFDYLCQSFGIELDYQNIDQESNDLLAVPFEYRRSAKLVDLRTGTVVGVIGEYKKSVAKQFKLPEYSAGFEIYARGLFESTKELGNTYDPLSRYPSAERDVCFQVGKDLSYSRVIDSLDNAVTSIDLITEISPVDIYQPIDGETKNITVRIKLTSYDHTLTSKEANDVIDGLVDSVISQTRAIVI
ncbi:MAG: phenylalanine--tRNA ligase subunit beta [Candidatus Saccharibacteria bacterium]